MPARLVTPSFLMISWVLHNLCTTICLSQGFAADLQWWQAPVIQGLPDAPLFGVCAPWRHLSVSIVRKSYTLADLLSCNRLPNSESAEIPLPQPATRPAGNMDLPGCNCLILLLKGLSGLNHFCKFCLDHNVDLFLSLSLCYAILLLPLLSRS